MAKKPNLIVILIDDLRFDETSASGHPYMKTPNIDRIAREGAMFENAFHTTPLCSPNRASILTGQYASRHGIIDNVGRDMRIYKEEIFGPVLSVVRAQNFEEALSLPDEHEYGNGVAIFTRNGDVARNFANKVQCGMVGINVPIPVPLSFHTFGGWKNSMFGDMNQHGPEGVRFYTRVKTVTARWREGVAPKADFGMPLSR